jgi:hypothetical protein
VADGTGNAYVVGDSFSDDMPVTAGAFQTFRRGFGDVYVTKLTLQPDFSFSPIADITTRLGESGSSSVTVNSFDDFSANVSLSLSQSNFTNSFSVNPVTPPANGSTSSLMTLRAGASVTPGSYTLTLTGTSGALSHTATFKVNVTATAAAIAVVIDTEQALGCIDNSGISNALKSKLSAAQADIDAGKTQEAINTLKALLNQLQAQAGKHISTFCTDSNGNAFDPDAALVADVNALLASLGVNVNATPITGNVLNASGAGLPGLAVNILNSSKVTVATATTDVTGFYYFPATGALTSGANYTVKVPVPKAYKSSTPASQSFTWKAAGLALGKFVLN